MPRTGRGAHSEVTATAFTAFSTAVNSAIPRLHAALP